MHKMQAGTNEYRLIIFKARKLSFSTYFNLNSTGSIEKVSVFIVIDFADRNAAENRDSTRCNLPVADQRSTSR
jgi:hypothetical protein